LLCRSQSDQGDANYNERSHAQQFSAFDHVPVRLQCHKRGVSETRPCSESDQGKYVTLVLEGLDAYQAGKLAPVKTIVVTSISGIGDDAYYLAVSSNVGLIVKKGDIAFKVAVYGDLPIEKKQAMEKMLAQQVVSRL
jgi:hypothetical protein